MSFVLSKKSLAKLQGVHPDLVLVVRRAVQLSAIDFAVTEGLRTVERQETLVASGASKTMKSRHLTGHAVDLVAMIDFDGDGKPEVRWDFPLYAKLAAALATDIENQVNPPVVTPPLPWSV